VLRYRFKECTFMKKRKEERKKRCSSFGFFWNIVKKREEFERIDFWIL
jgi:hypothetical protein